MKQKLYIKNEFDETIKFILIWQRKSILHLT